MKYSIITVTYNADKFIAKTIKSIANQTFKNFEYIVVDGKSNDNTIKLIDELKGGIKNFRLVSEKDSGLYDAMNKGLNLATGDFVWFINAGDEIYSTDTLEKIDAIASNMPSNFDIIYGQSIIIDNNGNEIGQRHKLAPKELTKNSLLKGLVVCHQSILVRNSIAVEYNLLYKISSDYDWIIRCVSQSKGNVYIDSYLSKFMTSGISSTNHKKSWLERYFIMKKHFGIPKTLLAHLLIAIKYPFSIKY